MNDGKKLKRGLEDLSPLFQEAVNPLVLKQPAAAEPLHQRAGDILAICRGDGSNFSGGLRLAGELFPAEKEAVLVSITGEEGSVPAVGTGLYHYGLTLPKLERLIRTQGVKAPPEEFSKNVILHFDLQGGLPAENLLPLLDKCLFWVQPDFDSLSEIYKNMKLMVAVNHGVECYLVYDGRPGDSRGEFIFENLAEMSAKHLGVNLIWLGTAAGSPEGGILCDLKLEPLWLRPMEKNLSPEKLQLLRFAALPPVEDGV